jgi:hypothetical protein
MVFQEKLKVRGNQTQMDFPSGKETRNAAI